MSRTNSPVIAGLTRNLLQWGIFIIIVTILLILDLVLKSWAAANLLWQPGRDIIPGFLGLTYTRNTGAAFGLFANTAWGRTVLTVFKIVVMCGLLWVYYYLSKRPVQKRLWLLRIPVILIFAGGVGNLIDRMAFGYVRDMLQFLFINFPIFNLADVYVVAGCFLGMFVMLFLVKEIP